MIATKERKFEDVIRILSKVSKKIYLHYMDSAFLKLRAYYELRMSYEAFNEIERIKKYFQSNKNIPSRYLKIYTSQLSDIIMLFRYYEKKIDENDFKMYIKKVSLDTRKTGKVMRSGECLNN
ncbi:MAG: hypothetical protein IPL53_19515 [Ignavibacteria bacterium]|nr:hypothetical protein [Ignavibacteria bacterium]